MECDVASLDKHILTFRDNVSFSRVGKLEVEFLYTRKTLTESKFILFYRRMENWIYWYMHRGLGIRCKRVAIFTFQPLYPTGNNP
jgi:hypothetical protein